MKILCAYSGIEFDCSHFPGTFYSRESYHPVFNLPQKKLLSYTGKWAAGELTRIDSYLLFLAILKSSDLVEFRVPVFRNEHTDAIIAHNMEPMVKVICKLNAVTNPAVTFPHFVITTETRFLSNVNHWIENWTESYQEFLDGARRNYDQRKLLHRENALQRMIKNPHKSVKEYANQIAEWAAIAGEFPVFLVSTPFHPKVQIPLVEYWKQIIIRCTKEEYLYSIPRNDLQELIDHCEDKIPVGTIFSNTLFKVLRNALEKQHNFLGLGDLDIKSTFTILSERDDIESANLMAAAQSAPLEEPRQEQYPSKLAFMKAKFRWEMAKKLEAEKRNSGDRRTLD